MGGYAFSSSGTFVDSSTLFVDDADPTKKLALQLSGIASATTRTLTVPDSNVTITTAAGTVLDDATVAAMVDTLGGAGSTGSGGLVRTTSPALVTPTLGVAAATSLTFGGTALATYLEETFTPTVTLVGGAGNTPPVYSTNTGRATRIGNKRFVDIYLTGDGGAEGAGTGTFNVALGATAGASNPTSFMAVGYGNNGATEFMPIFGQVAGGGTTIALYRHATLSTGANFTGADQNNTSRTIRLQFWHEL